MHKSLHISLNKYKSLLTVSTTMTATILKEETPCSMNNYAEFSELALLSIIDMSNYVRLHTVFINCYVCPFPYVIQPGIDKSTCIM